MTRKTNKKQAHSAPPQSRKSPDAPVPPPRPRGRPPSNGAAGLPLWYQVEQSLRAKILARGSAETLRLPTETALADSFGVSLITVRQALKVLQRDGLITRERSKGTFINANAPFAAPLKLAGSLDSVIAQQMSQEVTVLENKRILVPAELSPLFPDVKHVTLLRRLRRSEGEVVSYACNYLLTQYGSQVTNRDLLSSPVTKILRDKLAVPIRRIEDTVEARLPSPEVAAYLEIGLVSPVLFFCGITYNADNRVVDVARIHYRGDRFKFSVTLDNP